MQLVNLFVDLVAQFLGNVPRYSRFAQRLDRARSRLVSQVQTSADVVTRQQVPITAGRRGAFHVERGLVVISGDVCEQTQGAVDIVSRGCP